MSQAATPEERAAEYDEFAFLETYATHEGIPWHGRPAVHRESGPTGEITLSGLVWGADSPELIFLHGGGQNAHTWDSVAMALDRPLIAIDLPGHGHSDWRGDRDYHPSTSAVAVGEWLKGLPPQPRALIGMSLGGLTSIAVAASGVVPLTHLVIVDITPGVGRSPEQRPDGVVRLIQGQRIFDTFDDMLQATAALAPNRPVDSLRPGVLHNSRQLADGRWSWRYDQAGIAGPGPRGTTRTRRWSGCGTTCPGSRYRSCWSGAVIPRSSRPRTKRKSCAASPAPASKWWKAPVIQSRAIARSSWPD